MKSIVTKEPPSFLDTVQLFSRLIRASGYFSILETREGKIPVELKIPETNLSWKGVLMTTGDVVVLRFEPSLNKLPSELVQVLERLERFIQKDYNKFCNLFVYNPIIQHRVGGK